LQEAEKLQDDAVAIKQDFKQIKADLNTMNEATLHKLDILKSASSAKQRMEQAILDSQQQ